MNRSNHISETSGLAAWARRAAGVAAVLGLGLSVAVFAQSPTGTSPSGANTPTDGPLVYDWPNFHAGGATPNFVTPLTPLPGEPLIPYGQLQGTPTGLYTIPGALTTPAGTFTEPAGTQVTTQIPSRLLGNYLPSAPPMGFANNTAADGIAYFPNHFRDGGTPPFFQIVGPFGYTYPNPIPAGTTYPQVQSSPAAVNVTDFPALTGASYYGVAVNTSAVTGDPNTNQNAGNPPSPSQPDTIKFGNNASNADPSHEHDIRQVVYFGRTEVVSVIATPSGNTLGGVPTTLTAGTPVTVGAIYAMDGFTGGIIWRYQVPSFRSTSVAAAPNPFTATTSGTANSVNGNGPQPFQIGPTVGGVGSTNAALNSGAPGTLTISSSNLAGFAGATQQFTLYASSATAVGGASNQALYSGTYAIYPTVANGATPVPASQGYFTATATFTSATAANVVGTFTATSGTTAYSPATFNGTFTSGANGTNQQLTGTLTQTAGAESFGTPQVYSSPVVTKCLIAPPGGDGGNLANDTVKTVVIIADNNGFVYCLDAVGNGDGSSNSNIYPAGQAATVQQTGIAYDTVTSTAEGLPLDPSGNPAHVGTTTPYWVYRPDPTAPKYASGTTTQVGTLKPTAAIDPKSDLPVPGPFGMASANVYVNPTTNVGTVYIGNSNGVLYALNATGASSAAATATAPAPDSDPYNNPLTGLPGIPDTLNTPQPLWWFSTGGVGPNTNPITSIESAPAVYLDPNNTFKPVVYVGTASAQGLNSGRLYAVDGLLGPRGNNGESDNTNLTATSATYGGPGSPDYNVNARPYWAFPDQYGSDYVSRLPAAVKPAGYESWSTNGGLRPSLGDITGSPVVFNNPHDGSTRIYFAANAGTETRTEGTGTATFQAADDNNQGRVWGINPNGSASVALPTNSGTGTAEGAVPTWVYPEANNPNDAATDGATEPSQPLGGFRSATPAMGIVEFPETILLGDGTGWTHADHGGANGAARTLTFGGTVPYQQVAMLYVGTYTANDASFYEVDVDGQNDTERNIYRLVSPNGAGFQSSPALVTNSSTKGGNGGAVFISAGNTLFQFQATPESNPTVGSTAPFIAANGDAQISGSGPISSPAIAAADVSNLPGNVATTINGTTYGADAVRDWVYIADDTLSLCRGFTPDQNSFGNSAAYLPIPPVPSQVAASSQNGEFPLRAFVFDGTPTHAGTDANMNDANLLGGILPVFDWGQNAYIRIANVVPPANAVDNSNPAFPLIPGSTVNHQALVIDPATGLAYGNGGAVTFQLEDTSSSTNGTTQVSLQIPAVAPAIPPANIDTTQNGFYQRSDTGTPAETVSPASNYVLTNTGTASGTGWVAAYTYHLAYADGSLLANTPGAQRRIIGATQQVVTEYQLSGGTYVPVSSPVTFTDTMPVGPFLPTTSDTSALPGGYNEQNPPTTNGQTGSLGTPIIIDQPTFGVLNPLAVRGGGLPLGSLANSAPQPLGGYTQGGSLIDGIGPFRAVNPLLATQYDLEALENGNVVYTGAAPTSGTGVATQDPTKATVTLNAQAAALPQATLNVITSTPQILDGTQGDNTDPNGSNSAPPTGNYGVGGNGIAAGAGFGPAMLDVADRSLLSQVGQTLQINIAPSAAQWNDNTGGSGPGAVINHLPWEDEPAGYSSGSVNSSTDYPDIPSGDILNEFANGSSVTNATLPPTSAPGTTPGTAGYMPPSVAQTRQVNTESVRVQVNVPKYQPANLQLYQVQGPLGTQTQAAITPQNRANGAGYFPMGYISTEKITATTNGIHSAGDPNVAYRNAEVYTGVPVDIKTGITSPVTDVGTEPAGYGTQMAGLSYNGNAIGPFTPYSAYPGYAGHFQPLNIVSDSNVNLIDPHLDQKIGTVGTGAGQAPGLPLLSDANDSSLAAPYSYIPGYDFAAVSDLTAGTGPYTLNGTYTSAPLKTGISPQPYLIRTSLDTDVAEAFGRNPVIATQDTTGVYPVVTFHKPRVGDGNGTTMTVPDVPHDDTGNNAYYLPVNTAATPTLNGSGVPTAATLPYVGVAVPFGTPVGTYAQNLRLFEGFDPNTYDPLVGPTYGGAYGGQTAFNPNTLDTLLLTYNNKIARAIQPYSDPATQIKVTVGEDRMTNFYTKGALPMIDLGVANSNNIFVPTNFENFAPFALGLPGPGSLGLYWATSRDYTPGTANTQFRLNAAALNTKTNGGLTTYVASSSGRWWEPLGNSTTFDLPNQPNGNNVAFSVAQLQSGFGTGFGLDSAGGTLYGFDTNILANGPLSQTSLYCYPLTGGAPTGTGITVASSPQPKSDQHGLSFTLSSGFTDPNGGAAIGNNLWSFWTGGTRGRTALYYSSANTSGTASLVFATPAVLPVPAGLTAISDPNPVLTNAPDLASTTGAPVPAIEVTYSGTGASGNPDLYLSRYRPYRTTTTPQQILLGLMPFPAQREQLLPDTANLNTNSWWQARDVGWVRNQNLALNVNVSVPGTVSGTNIPYVTYAVVLTLNPNNTTYTGYYGSYNSQYNIPQSEGVVGTGTTFTGNVVYDRASGVLILTNATLPRANGSGVTFAAGQNVYIDVAGGRARFSVQLPYSSPEVDNKPSSYATVAANFNATARRITTGPASDTQPVAFLDEAYQSNSSGVPTDQNVQADRYWYIWRKTGVTGANPTLWYKTQRLAVTLTGPNGQPISIDPTTLTVTLQPSGASLYTAGAGNNVVDVDPTRGRLYFPITYTSNNQAGNSSSTAMEGQKVLVTVTGRDVNNNPVTITLQNNPPGNPPGYLVTWQDEPLSNDPNNEAGVGYLEAAAADGHQIPLITTINEGGVSAFLDAGAFLNGTGNTPGNINPGTFNVPANVVAAPHPHKVWLFWTSNRNGVADIYSETINPRFSAVGDSGSP